jgi:hypothetical protein
MERFGDNLAAKREEGRFPLLNTIALGGKTISG